MRRTLLFLLISLMLASCHSGRRCHLEEAIKGQWEYSITSEQMYSYYDTTGELPDVLKGIELKLITVSFEENEVSFDLYAFNLLKTSYCIQGNTIILGDDVNLRCTAQMQRGCNLLEISDFTAFYEEYDIIKKTLTGDKLSLKRKNSYNQNTANNRRRR